MHGLFDPLIPKEQAFEFARKIIGAGGSAKVKALQFSRSFLFNS